MGAGMFLLPFSIHIFTSAVILDYHTINIMFKTVTHTLMESCCVEAFLLSAENEDI